MSNLLSLPLKNLKPWKDNPRKSATDEDVVNSLKASIKSHGIFQNLVVCPSGSQKDSYVVIAGASRLEALNALAAEGEIDESFDVPCQVRPSDDINNLSLALAENVIRQDMDPIDEAIAFSELTRKGMTREVIGEVFGYSTKVVKKRLALGRLVPEAQQLIREARRDLAWGAAMADADKETQGRICKDISSDPNSWQTFNEVKRFLTAEAIPFEHALFDEALYQGEVQQTLFDGNFFKDREAFWELQDEEIDKKAAELGEEGWSSVQVHRGPLDLWRYDRGADPEDGMAIIEVLSNGKVTTHTGLVNMTGMSTSDEAEEDDAEDEESQEVHSSGYAGSAVRPTPSVLAYCADERSAMLQAKVGGDIRASMELVVAALIGHSEIPMHAVDHRFAGKPESRVSENFDQLQAMHDELQDIYAGLGLAPGRGGAEVLHAVHQMDDATLERAFCLLTAFKIGQTKPRKLDTAADSMTNVLAEQLAVDPRAGWRPSESFFELMSTADLRRMAQSLLPLDRQAGVADAKKANLVRLLEDAFADAKAESGLMAPEDRDRLNAWVPGPMTFPASDESYDESSLEAGGDDPFAALFGDSGEVETEAEEDYSEAAA